MHDEEMVSKNEAETNVQADGSVSTLDPIEQTLDGDYQDGNGVDPDVGEPTESDEKGTDDADPALSDDSVSDPDPLAAESTEEAAEDSLEQLRSELNRLKSDLQERDAAWRRIGLECEEFFALYPDTPLSSVPDGVWEDVKKGVPIAAAFALAKHKQNLAEQSAKDFNRANDLRSSGALKATEPDYFSPTEVRAMSQSEVRSNYQNIMKSMQKWK